MRLFVLFAFLGAYVSGCAFTVEKPCAEGGEPARSVPIKGTKQCLQQKDSTGHYRNHGNYIEWHPNGNRATKGDYKMGKKDGKWMEWDETGKLTAERWYEDGVETPPNRPSGR